MTTICSDPVTREDLIKVDHASFATLSFTYYFEGVFALLCSIVLFGWYRRLSKPTFVCIMWALFVAAEISHIANARFLQLNGYIVPSGETYNVHLVALLSGHWVFAIQYAEVVLKLPLLVFPEQSRDIIAEIKKVSRVIWALNGIFAAVLITYTILLQQVLFDDTPHSTAKFGLEIASFFAYIAPIALLLVAVLKVRCMVSKLRVKAIF